jgi:anti-sigma B factor antagonist
MLAVEQHENECQVVIDGEMTIYTAAELKAQLIPVLTVDKPLRINLANVTEIDSAGVQLLMLAKNSRVAREQHISLTDHSDAVTDVFQLMDLISYFNDPILLPGDKVNK